MPCPKKDYPEKVVGIIKTSEGLYKIATYAINKEKRARLIDQTEPDILGIAVGKANHILSGISSDYIEDLSIEEMGAKQGIKVKRLGLDDEHI
jgi:hypothetical protein